MGAPYCISPNPHLGPCIKIVPGLVLADIRHLRIKKWKNT